MIAVIVGMDGYIRHEEFRAGAEEEDDDHDH